MTVQLIAEQEIFFGGYRFTSQANALAESLSIAALDASVLGNDTMIHEPGLKGYGSSLEGFYNPAEDLAAFGYHRTRNVPITFALTDGSVGSPMRTVLAMIADHSIIEGARGELAKLALAFAAMDAPVLGKVLHNAEASGNVTGTAVDVTGAAPQAGQSIYAALHVFSGSGDLDVIVESDDNSGMTSPTTRFTFAQVGTATAQAYEWAAPITTGERYWRVSATNPATRDFAVVLAIQ